MDHCLQRNGAYVWRDIGGEVVILNADGTEVCLLNETAAAIWALCDGRRSIQEVARLLEAEYDVPHDEALADVQELAQQLVAAGLAQWAAEG